MNACRNLSPLSIPLLYYYTPAKKAKKDTSTYLFHRLQHKSSFSPCNGMVGVCGHDNRKRDLKNLLPLPTHFLSYLMYICLYDQERHNCLAEAPAEVVCLSVKADKMFVPCCDITIGRQFEEVCLLGLSLFYPVSCIYAKKAKKDLRTNIF